jgi:hypothetical protein
MFKMEVLKNGKEEEGKEEGKEEEKEEEKEVKE